MSDNRKAVDSMTKRLLQSAKRGGGSMSHEQARKISAAAVVRTEKKDYKK